MRLPATERMEYNRIEAIPTGVRKMSSDTDETMGLDRQIVEVLVSRLESSPSTITYGDLASQLSRRYGREDARAWHYFDDALGRIQDTCVELGLPSLPVMVVKKDGMKPGTGYAAHYRELHPEAVSITDDEIGKEQWKAVRTFGGWQAILDRYGIEMKFAGPKDIRAELAAASAFEESRRISEQIVDEVRRSRDARVLCIEKKGSTCVVCGFNSAEAYGVEGIIHAHHVRPLYELAAGETARVDPLVDLEPVCPNCHALIHSKGPRECYTIVEARQMLQNCREGDAH